MIKNSLIYRCLLQIKHKKNYIKIKTWEHSAARALMEQGVIYSKQGQKSWLLSKKKMLRNQILKNAARKRIFP